ncbi:hypothetical protein AGOR_G00227220 [Albula goreensis]|uniref:Uncharacterized protein n=1 Tax=Albula goreensis TaxID=1534307 RepID=A0A8T3CL21_9TELE|nr:hypothetical protein AGOR_G00227220 [Albula goreensis]
MKPILSSTQRLKRIPVQHHSRPHGHTPLYLEILPEETTTNQGNVERNKVVHTFFSKRPLPPVPRSKSHPEPLYEEIQWTSNNQNVQSVQIEKHKKEDVDALMAWWNTVEQWENMPLHCGLREEEETRAFTITAYRVQMGVRLFSCLLTKNNEKLRNHMTELNTIANNLDKMRKKAKIAAITGGTTGAMGGVAAVAGLVLAPMTMGASLVVTAIGAGVAAAGGVTGASAAITDKVNSNLDRKRVEKLVQDYRSEMSLIESCLQFVDAGMERMRAQDASRLRDVDEETVAVARLAELAGRNAGTIQTACQTVKVLEAFSLDMDFFFTPGQSQRLKKGSETKFAGQIRDLVQQLEEGQTKLIKVRDILSLAASTTGVYKEHSYRL